MLQFFEAPFIKGYLIRGVPSFTPQIARAMDEPTI